MGSNPEQNSYAFSVHIVEDYIIFVVECVKDEIKQKEAEIGTFLTAHPSPQYHGFESFCSLISGLSLKGRLGMWPSVV